MFRYRILDAAGDMTFGHGKRDFLVDSVEAVAQSVQTRLLLFTGEWFLNLSDGTPWLTEVVGERTRPLADVAIRSRIQGTFGVVGIISYSSHFNPATRQFVIACRILTIFSLRPVTISRPDMGGFFTLDVTPLDDGSSAFG